MSRTSADIFFDTVNPGIPGILSRVSFFSYEPDEAAADSCTVVFMIQAADPE
jgi:hypothetical protein